MLQPQEITVADFSGGITDYVLAANPNQSKTLNNVLINPNKRLNQAHGSEIYSDSEYITPFGNVRICGLFPSVALNTLILNSGKHFFITDGLFTELLGPTGNTAFPNATTSDFVSLTEYGETVYATSTSLNLPVKMYADGSSVNKLRTAGLPYLASTPTVSSLGGSGNNYIYGFAYFYTYNVGTVIFEDYGPVTYVQQTNIGEPSVNNVNITVIPVLSNGSTGNYDTSVTGVKTKIYRTDNNGTVLYEIGIVSNGTTIFTDNVSNASVINGNIIYTAGDVLDNDPPPPSKYIHIVNGIAYYGYVKEGTEILKNRVRQSIQDDPDSCPSICYIDFLDEVVGISSYNDNPIVFTKGHVYRLNGYINELGQGAISAEDITKTIGCKGNNSIVQTRFGVFWAGDDGFYWTDGFQFKKVSDSINETYKTIISNVVKFQRIYGTFDKVDNRVIWCVQFDVENNDNDAFIVLDLRWGVNDASSFTTRTNGSSFYPTAVCYYNGNLIRADSRGYLFKHNSTYTTDPMVDETVAAPLWNRKAIIIDYKSTVSDLGLPYVRKWVPKILLTLENKSNASVQINSINDDTGAVDALYPIRYWDNILWGDPDPIWGNDLIFWNYYNLIEEMRRFPSGSLRCSYKQIEITNGFTNIYNSNSLGTAYVDNINRTATLVGSTYLWPEEIVDYYITFESDGYVENYLIDKVNSTTEIKYLDPLSNSPLGTQKWLIRGIPKGQVINIISFVIYYSPLTDQSFKTYRREQDRSGDNA